MAGGLIVSFAGHFLPRNNSIIGGLKYSFPVVEFAIYALFIHMVGIAALKCIAKMFFKKF